MSPFPQTTRFMLTLIFVIQSLVLWSLFHFLQHIDYWSIPDERNRKMSYLHLTKAIYQLFCLIFVLVGFKGNVNLARQHFWTQKKVNDLSSSKTFEYLAASVSAFFVWEVLVFWRPTVNPHTMGPIIHHVSVSMAVLIIFGINEYNPWASWFFLWAVCLNFPSFCVLAWWKRWNETREQWKVQQWAWMYHGFVIGMNFMGQIVITVRAIQLKEIAAGTIGWNVGSLVLFLVADFQTLLDLRKKAQDAKSWQQVGTDDDDQNVDASASADVEMGMDVAGGA